MKMSGRGHQASHLHICSFTPRTRGSQASKDRGDRQTVKTLGRLGGPCCSLLHAFERSRARCEQGILAKACELPGCLARSPFVDRRSLPRSVPSGHPRSPLKIGGINVALGHKQCVINAHGGTSLPIPPLPGCLPVSTQARVEPAKETARQDAPALALWKAHQNFGGLDPRFRRYYTLLGPAPFCRGAPKAVSFQPIQTHSRPCEPSSNPLSVLSRLVRPDVQISHREEVPPYSTPCSHTSWSCNFLPIISGPSPSVFTGQHRASPLLRQRSKNKPR